MARESAAQKKERLAAERLAQLEKDNAEMQQQLADAVNRAAEAEEARMQEAATIEQLGNEARTLAEEKDRLAQQLQEAQFAVQEKHADAVEAKMEATTYKSAAQTIADKAKQEIEQGFASLLIHVDRAITDKLPHVAKDLKKVAGFPKWAKITLAVLAAVALFAAIRPHFQNQAIAKELVQVREGQKTDVEREKEMKWIDYKIEQSNKLLMQLQGRDDTATINRVKLYAKRLREVENNKNLKDAIIKNITNPSISDAVKLDRFTELVFADDTSSGKND